MSGVFLGTHGLVGVYMSRFVVCFPNNDVWDVTALCLWFEGFAFGVCSWDSVLMFVFGCGFGVGFVIRV